MIIITGGPGSGKSTELVRKSAETSLPIVCSEYPEMEHLQTIAIKLDLDIPSPIHIRDLLQGGYDIESVILDDTERILKRLLGKNIHTMSIQTNLHQANILEVEV